MSTSVSRGAPHQHSSKNYDVYGWDAPRTFNDVAILLELMF
jgi:hypothetical protein